MKASTIFSVLVLFLTFTTTAAQAKVIKCEMNGHIEVDGSKMDVRLLLDWAWWGYGKVKAASYS